MGLARFSLPHPPMGRLWDRIRDAWRLLLRSPAFVASVVLPLGLALGANTALFSVVRGVLLRPLPYPESENLLRIRRVAPEHPDSEGGPVSPLNYRDDLQSFPGFAKATTWAMTSGTLGFGQSSEHVDVGVATASYLSVLRVSPRLGRWFTEEEETLGNDREIVISQALWQRRFGSDPGVLGRTVDFEGLPYTVVGVLPAEPALTSPADAWVPLAFRPDQLEPQARNRHFLEAMGRLAPGVSAEHANQMLADVARRTIADHPEAYGTFNPWRYIGVPLHDYQVRAVRPTLALLFAAVTLVLLMACANVGNLLLARATTRERELAVRAALGAGRGELIRQLLAESVLLALVAGILGVGLAAWAVPFLISLAPDALPRAGAVRIDGTVLLFSLLLSIGAGLLFGVFPAFSTSQISLDEALRSGAASSRPRPRRLRRILVVVDVALALVLLSGTALLVRSFVNTLRIDPGFRSDGVTTLRMIFPVPSHETMEESSGRIRVAVDRVRERLQELGGVEAVGAVTLLPMSGNRSDRLFEIEGHPMDDKSERPPDEYRVITPDYFRAMGIPLLKGRDIAVSDRADGAPVLIVSQAFERHWLPEGALGRRVRLLSPATPWATIVGVVGDVRDFGLDASVHGAMYYPLSQASAEELGFAIRTAGPPGDIARAAVQALQSLDSKVPPFDIEPMEGKVSASTAQRRFSLFLIATFAGVALLLAAVGLYGVVAYTVRQRTREIGVRMALGADPGRIVAMVARESGWMLGIGLLGGAVGALITARLLAGFLVGIGPADPTAFGTAGLVLAMAAAIATVVPVQRATRVDAALALASE